MATLVICNCGHQFYTKEDSSKSRPCPVCGHESVLPSPPNRKAGSFWGRAINWFRGKKEKPLPAHLRCSEEVTALVNRAVAEHQKGNFQAAITAFSKAIELNPGFSPPYALRGNARTDAGDYGGAIADFTSAIEINPDESAPGLQSSYYSSRGWARLKRSEPDGAIVDSNQAIQLDPQNALAYFNRAIARNELHDHEGAIAEFDSAVRRFPESARNFDVYFSQAHYNRGNTLFCRGEFFQSIAAYDKALALNKDYEQAYANRGLARQQTGDLDGAISDFTKAIALNPNDFLVYGNRGIALLLQKKDKAARLDFAHVVRLRPDLEPGLENRIRELQEDLSDQDRLDRLRAKLDPAPEVHTYRESY